MIPLAVPIVFAVVALVAWRYEARAQQAYEATLSAAEKRQFRALRRIHPLRWRAAIALKQAEAAVTARIRPQSNGITVCPWSQREFCNTIA